MFKLLMFFVIIILIIIFSVACYKALKPLFQDGGNVNGDVDEYIKIIKNKVNEYQEKTKQGMENAEAKLAFYKEELKKAEQLKKTHNL